MIENSVIVAMMITGCATLFLPIIIPIILGVTKKMNSFPFFIGVAAFFVSQVVLRIPLLGVLSQTSAGEFISTPIGRVLIGGLSAGLFEETARLISARFILKNRLTYKDTISFGLGHSLFEVFFLVGINMFTYAIWMIMINNGSFDGAFAVGMSTEQLAEIKSMMTSMTVENAILSLVERFSAVMFHVFATVLVFKGVREKKIVYYFMAILAHTVFNSVAVFVSNIYVVEVIMLALAIAGTVYTIKQKEVFEGMN